MRPELLCQAPLPPSRQKRYICDTLHMETLLKLASFAEIIGYKWKLPSLPKQYKGCSVIYSNKHGLIAIGGHEKSHKFMNVHTLSFQTEHIDGNEWKWNNITKTEVSRQHPCCVIIGGGEDKLMAMGGYQYGRPASYSQSTVARPAMKRTECYDFNSGQWMSLKNAIYPRQKCGMFYDKHKNNIFLVGGQDGYGYSLNKFECYDIAQNVWYRLPSTNEKHGCYPVVWHEENKNILCVASLTGNVIECIDLRQDAAKWNVVYAKGNVYMTLGKLFQIKIGIDIFNFQVQTSRPFLCTSLKKKKKVTDCCRLLKFN